MSRFTLRYVALVNQHQRRSNPTRGLAGGRVSLIPHQLYIAHEVGHRYAPRVLLADEVGLGKTIEAGMIIHQQLLSGRAHRVLILLPELMREFSEYRMLMFGALMVLMMIWRPQGLLPMQRPHMELRR